MSVIPRDKSLHFWAGTFIALLAGFVLGPFEGLVLSVAAGMGKEWYDSYFPSKHTVDHWDAWSTIIGGLFGTALVVLPW